MKRNLLFGIVLSSLVIAPSFAAVTPSQATEPEYIMNQGYSQLTAEDIFLVKNRVNGKAVEPLYETKADTNKLVRGWKWFWSYVDPARDEVDRIHHDVKPNPDFTDL